MKRPLVTLIAPAIALAVACSDALETPIDTDDAGASPPIADGGATEPSPEASDDGGEPPRADGGDADASHADAGDADADVFAPLIPSLATGRRLAVGRDHTCLLNEEGRVRCWGRNINGELGYGDLNNRGDDPGEIALLEDVPLGGPVAAIAAGGSVSCAVRSNGEVLCWGAGGRVGNGATGHVGSLPGQMPPAPLALGGPARQVVIGHFHACALKTNGDVVCWGLDTDGSLGRGSAGDTIGDEAGEMPPPPVDLGEPAVALVSGAYSTCAALASGALRCWGSARYNPAMLGHGSATEHVGDEPGDLPPANVPLGGLAFSSLYAGVGHACVRSILGGALCWGDNTYNQLGPSDPAVGVGVGDAPGEMPPPRLGAQADGGAGPLDIASMALGNGHTCSLSSGGWVRCWGRNNYGQCGVPGQAVLGDEPGEFPPVPAVSVDATDPVVEIAAGLGNPFTCARLASGNVRCWGRNNYGQLGLGHTSNVGDDEVPSSVAAISIF